MSSNHTSHYFKCDVVVLSSGFDKFFVRTDDNTLDELEKVGCLVKSKDNKRAISVQCSDAAHCTKHGLLQKNEIEHYSTYSAVLQTVHWKFQNKNGVKILCHFKELIPNEVKIDEELVALL